MSLRSSFLPYAIALINKTLKLGDPCCGLCTLLMCFLCATADKKSGGGGGGTSDQVYYENKRNSGHYDPPYIPDAPNPPAPDTTDDSDGGAGRR